MLSELLAYGLGRAHGREQERRRASRREYRRGDEPGRVEVVCAWLVLISIAAVVIVAIFPA